MAPRALPLKPGYVFRPTGPQFVGLHLFPRAGLGGRFFPGYIEEGVDIFSMRPRALPFWPIHRRQDGEVWGFFFAARPAAGEACPGPGGCWVRYGSPKAYCGQEGAEAVAFRRRFASFFTWMGRAVWAPTLWLMKEYRLNTDATVFRAAHPTPMRRASSSCSTRSSGGRCSLRCRCYRRRPRCRHRLSGPARAGTRAPTAPSWTRNCTSWCYSCGR